MRLRFGGFVFDGGRRQLLRDGAAVPLAPRPFALLELLLERRPEAVSKDEILERVWEGAVVSETALTTAMGELRLALGESAREPVHLRTAQRFGYAFQGEVIDVGRATNPLRAMLVSPEQRVELRDGELVLGRHGEPVGDVVDPSVSRHHARLRIDAGGIVVEDLDSKNGTWVNGARVERPTPVSEGDELRLGRFAFVLRTVRPDAETETNSSLPPFPR